MNNIPEHIEKALESDCATDMCRLIEKKRPEDFLVLKSLISSHPSKPQYRQRAIYAIGRWKDPPQADVIWTVLPELDEKERITAIDALGRLKNPESAKAIIPLTHDGSLLVRKYVVKALGKIASDDAKKALQGMKETDSSEFIRNLADRWLKGCPKKRKG